MRAVAIQCGHQRICYRYCRNRHCPRCQSLARDQWIQRRQAELLNCSTFTLCFTVPEEIAARSPTRTRRWSTASSSEATAENPTHYRRRPPTPGCGDRLLRRAPHLRGSNLQHHPHLHCVVPGGGLSADGTCWVSCKPGFFLPVRVLSRLFRRLFSGISAGRRIRRRQAAIFYRSGKSSAIHSEFARHLVPLRKAEWVVYAKVARWQALSKCSTTSAGILTASRFRTIAYWTSRPDQVRFQWKDYRHKGRQKAMKALSAAEFIRRFLLHALPDRFQRIRYYGLLGNRYRQQETGPMPPIAGHGSSGRSSAARRLPGPA